MQNLDLYYDTDTQWPQVRTCTVRRIHGALEMKYGGLHNEVLRVTIWSTKGYIMKYWGLYSELQRAIWWSIEGNHFYACWYTVLPGVRRPGSIHVLLGEGVSTTGNRAITVTLSPGEIIFNFNWLTLTFSFDI